MKKLALFVEGQTEQLFAEKLLIEVAGTKNIQIENRKASGGSSAHKRSMVVLSDQASNASAKYYAMIVDCGTDNRVASDVKENFEQLICANYEAIVGLRDVYPQTVGEIPKLRQGLLYSQKTKPFPPLFVLGVMEIEAWFLAEHTHFANIHNSITLQAIKQRLGFDPSIDDMSARSRPALDLHNAYSLGGCAYTKRRENAKRTIDCLDYTRCYCALGAMFPDFRNLIDCFDRFLS